MINGEKIDRESCGLMKGEWNELKTILGIGE